MPEGHTIHRIARMVEHLQSSSLPKMRGTRGNFCLGESQDVRLRSLPKVVESPKRQFAGVNRLGVGEKDELVYPHFDRQLCGDVLFGWIDLDGSSRPLSVVR
jgi:hypothetical protein